MAGVSTKEIKTRIRSMQATRKITKAMELVASSKLRRAQAQALASRPYFETLYATVQSIVATNRELSSPYLKAGEGKKPLYLVIAGDRGLAGGYNGNMFKLVHSQIRDSDATVLPIGKKAVEYFRSHNVPVADINDAEAAAATVGDCFTASKQLCSRFRSGEFDSVYICYTRFVSVLTQEPRVLKMLPLQRQDLKKRERPGQVTVYEPSSEAVFDTIIPEYLGGVLYGALCESRASEQAARRRAMDSATKNADEMIGDLSLKYNRARQAAITQEITEIIAGAKRS